MPKDPKQPLYGPHNPHPLSQLKTELVWEGKYDEYGNRREVDFAGCAMPMQRIETIDQPRSDAAATGQLALFEQKSKRLDDFRNMLVWGDNKLVMASLLKDYKSKIDLIYIDPPFDVGADFTMDVPIGDEKETVEKDQSILEMVAYRDMWGKGTDSYIHLLYERLTLMRDLLHENGSIFVHCDWRLSGHIRQILDEVFGSERLVNEIAWCYTGPSSPGMKGFAKKHDTIYWYSKSSGFQWNVDEVRLPYKESTKKNEGKRTGFTTGNPNLVVELNPLGKYPEDWWEIPVLAPASDERQEVGYPTQKSEALLERVIKSCTSDGQLVADFFCGGGTTGAVAERLGRRWIMADIGRFAIHTSRKRLITLQRRLHKVGKPYRAFDVHNLGRYERQWWQKERLKGEDAEHRRVVIEFFKADMLKSAPSPLLHGNKGTAFCHVDGIDSIFTRVEAREVASAVKDVGGKECYCLAWEFEMELQQVVAELQSELGVKLLLIQIPREIMEKNRKEPPPFLVVAALEAEPVLHGSGKERMVDIKLTKFLPSLAEVPTKELQALKERATKSGFDFIDFWAVDFDWHPDRPFNHHWQDYRTRKDRSLKTVSDAGYHYPGPGTYTACVKVVDVFGCDTSITVPITV